jgi:hypothetical protein
VPPRSVAQAFADHLNSLLNQTVTDARLTVIGDPTHSARFTLACLRGTTPISFVLHGSRVRLLIVQTLRVSGEHCQTLTYQYRLSSGEDKPSWLMRWEYFRHRPTPDYPYPLAHVHVNADLLPRGADLALAKLHIPTRRVPLELVLWHAIAEWGVVPKRDDWQALLEASIAEFERRRSVP